VRKRVLIITYYWPPAGGSGVQRWLKFTKYLRTFGWEPVIYTAANPEAPAMDHELLNEIPEGIEVLKKSVWEPYNLFRAISGRKGQKFGAGLASNKKSSKGIMHSFALWVRGNLFIPDARMFWIRPSVKYLSKYLSNNSVDAIVSSGPPHTTHLIAKRISKRFSIPWLADFRDPWTNIDFFDDLKPTLLSKKIHRRLERNVLTHAQRVVTVTKGWANDLSLIGKTEVLVVENGYDPEDFETGEVTLDKGFILTHIGTLSPNRNCNLLWQVLGDKVKNDAEFAKHFKLRFVGSVDASAHNAIVHNGLLPYTDFMGYMPHNQAIDLQLRSSVLLLLVNNSPNAMGIQTGKVFEYMAAKRPIFAVGPLGGNTHDLISETKAGIFADFTDLNQIKQGVESLWDWYGNDFKGFSPKGFESYSRKTLAHRIVAILDDLVK